MSDYSIALERFRVMVHPDALECDDSGTITGRLWLQMGDVVFPKADWIDLPVVALRQWVNSLADLLQWNHECECCFWKDRWVFFNVRVTTTNQFEVRALDREDFEYADIQVDPATAVREILNAAESVSRACQQQSWCTQDVGKLRAAIARLSKLPIRWGGLPNRLAPPTPATFHDQAERDIDAFCRMHVNSGNAYLVDGFGMSLLHYAAWYGSLGSAQLLLTSGARTDAIGSYWWIPELHRLTPLHLAAWASALEVVRALLMAGADVNAKDSDGNSPLHYAAHSGSRECAIELIAHGTEVKWHNVDGESYGQVARKAGFLELAAWLDSV